MYILTRSKLHFLSRRAHPFSATPAGVSDGGVVVELVQAAIGVAPVRKTPDDDADESGAASSLPTWAAATASTP